MCGVGKGKEFSNSNLDVRKFQFLCVGLEKEKNLVTEAWM
jgi:hypothetical protein